MSAVKKRIDLANPDCLLCAGCVLKSMSLNAVSLSHTINCERSETGTAVCTCYKIRFQNSVSWLWKLRKEGGARLCTCGGSIQSVALV